jgi:hypothetical protein
MLDWSCLFGLPSDSLKDTFMLYKRVTEQYENPEILKKVRSLIPQDIVLKTATKEEDSDNIIPLLKWFKNEFMKWTPKDPVCEICSNRSDSPSDVSESSSSCGSVASKKNNNR